MPTSTASQPGLPQIVGKRNMIAPGIMKLHDGAFQTGWEIFGPDQEYADYDTMAYLADQLNTIWKDLGNGWMIEANSFRVPVVIPPYETHCPETTSALIAEERSRQYAEEGEHFETKLILTLTFLPSREMQQKFRYWAFEGKKRTKQQSRAVLLALFKAKTDDIARALSHFLTLHRLEDDELIHFLRFCVTGEDRLVGYPPNGDMLNYAIGSSEWRPHRGKMGSFHTRVVGITGFPDGTVPQMFADVLTAPFPFRMSQRFICLDKETAVKLLTDKINDWGQVNWYNPWRMFWGMFQKPLKVDPNDEDVVEFNEDADLQKQSTRRAKTEVQEGRIHAGLYTFCVVLHDANKELAELHAAEIVQRVNHLGFSAWIETDNAGDAELGSWPGNGTANARQPILTTRHFAQLMPTSSPWTGEKTHPNPYYPPNSGPLIITRSTGNTPFLFNTHEHSAGNVCVVGPVGSGKTVLANGLVIGHLQYPRAQVNFFDRGYGALVTTLACGGEVFDLHAMRFAPLAHIDEQEERTWALSFIEKCATMRGFKMTPLAQRDLRNAMTLMGSEKIEFRTMTNFISQVPTSQTELREALKYYTLGQGGAVIDGIYSPQHESHWRTFEMEKVLGMEPELRSAVLTVAFHAMERRMDGRPTFQVIEEGWQAAADEVFRKRTEEDSANNRKRATSMCLVLHSPADFMAFDRPGLLLSNISTIVFLANGRAMSEGENGLRKHYAALGLGQREIRMLAEDMHPALDYYGVRVRENKRRKFQLAPGPLEKAFLHVNGRDHKDRILALRAQHSDLWAPEWLVEQGHADLAAQWKDRNQQQRRAA